jgi:hypothetical protein
VDQDRYAVRSPRGDLRGDEPAPAVADDDEGTLPGAAFGHAASDFRRFVDGSGETKRAGTVAEAFF